MIVLHAHYDKDAQDDLEEAYNCPVPRLPRGPPQKEHRERKPIRHRIGYASVARSVNKKEVAQSARAQASMKKEWDKLRAAKAWREDLVREYRDVQAEAKRLKRTYHFGRVFAICVEKDAELALPEHLRKYKGRVVFQGNQVKDEFGDWAIFQEISLPRLPLLPRRPLTHMEC